MVHFKRCLVSLAILLSVSLTSVGQSVAGKKVAAIRIAGNHQVSESYIRQQIRNVKVSKVLSLFDIQKDVDKLKLTGKFSDVYATTSESGGGVIVVFHVQERATIKSIEFIGINHVSDKELRGVIGFKEGDFLDDLAVRGAVDSILKYYHDKGYNEASVTLDENSLREGAVVFRITEGPLVRVTGIRFEGNLSFSDRRLSGHIETRKHFWLIRTGAYSENKVQDDILSLRNFYRREGFLDAKVGRRLDYGPERENLTVTFVIDEGHQYTVGRVKVEGNKHFSSDEIISHMGLESGSVLNLDQLDADRRSIVDFYGNNGFIYANVQIKYVYTDTPGVVDLHVIIDEGKSYKVGRIVIRGNKRTQDRVIRRMLEFYPGDTFDRGKMNERKRRLYETRLFKEVDIKPVAGDSPDEQNVLINVEGADTTRLMAGVGVTSNSGVMGTLSIETWNFDLFDWPRTWGEFFRGQAFKGGGQTLKLSLEPGTKMTRFRIDFHEPYLFDRPLSLGWSAYLFDRDRDGYQERRAGTVLSLGKRFRKHYSFRTAFRIEAIDVDDVDNDWWWYGAKDIQDVEGWSMLTSLKLSLIRDTTDSMFMPSSGTRMETSWEQAGLFGGDYDFAKLIGHFTYYRTLRTDVYDRKTIWASNMMMGYIAGDAPVFERFYGGGIGSIRGFSYRGISPRQGYDNTQVGGDFQLVVGNEVSFPIAGKNLRGVTFLDMGTVEDGIGVSDWRASVGFGLRLVIDYFGPIPMAFDFAFPITKKDEDDTQVFSFSLGATFK